MKGVQFLNDVPKTECWLILKNKATHHEADAVSKQHSGHGYMEHTDHTIEVDLVCDTEAEFLEALSSRIRQSNDDGSYRGFKVQPYLTKLTVDAKIQLAGAGSTVCPDCESMLSGKCLQHRRE
jgi:hypothetical protein